MTKPKPKAKPKLEERKVELDKTDILSVENSVLKDQNEKYRNELRKIQLKREREALHDYFVNKYKINLDEFTFSINEGKVLFITPK